MPLPCAVHFRQRGDIHGDIAPCLGKRNEKQRRDQQRRRSLENPEPKPDLSPGAGWLWGSDAIGKYINRTPDQVLHLHATGRLDGCVFKLGNKQLIGLPQKLDALAERLAAES